jgi:hypothetical protein
MKHQNLLQWMARIGYAARGLVFLLVGGFALLAASASRRPVGARGALEGLLAGPAGDALLWTVAGGLACFAVWRLLQAVLDADHEGRDMRGLWRRFVYLGSALFYVGLAVWVASFTFAPGNGSEDQAPRDWTAWLMTFPFGRWLVAALGITVTIGGVASGFRGWRIDYDKKLAMPKKPRRVALAIGRFGFVARALVLAVVGIFLIVAAWHANAHEAIGIAGALRALQREPYGWALLGITAIGFLAFGSFQIVQAIYRHVDAPETDEIVDEIKK